MTAFFAAAIFLSSALLFWLEPLFGKMVLPYLGGAPPAWNACILFYQVALIAGYAWAHAAVRIGTRRHLLIHLALSIAALASLPFAIPAQLLPPASNDPLRWILLVLTVGIGLPFTLVAANGPLLQRAYSRSDSPRAGDPYFLYAASNLGSAVALVSYPLVFERFLSLSEQGTAWRATYVVLLLALAGCAAIVLRRPAAAPTERVLAVTPPVPWSRRLKWVTLAAIPSSLMLGVTSYISAEVAPVPLIWIVPLALYLGTMVAAFAATDRLASWIRAVVAGSITRRGAITTGVGVLGIFMAAVIVQLTLGNRAVVIAAHLALFTFAALLCHVRLAEDRPPPARLTEYFLWMSIGGGIGGAFNTLVGPALFTAVLEYPLALAAVIMVLPARQRAGTSAAPNRGDFLWPVAIGCAAAVVPLILRAVDATLPFSPRLLLAVPALAALGFSGRPIRFGGSLLAVVAASAAYPSEIGSIEYATRNFYSVHRVLRDDRNGFRWLTHGVTVHGGQRLADTTRPVPLTYYTPSGPAGDAFRVLAPTREAVGLIGLGAGALAYYARPGQRWTLFEIDPAVISIARDDRFFQFLKRMRSPYRVVEGDARLSLERDTARFDILVLDAFASDVVPMHLLTREAIRVYLSRLRPGGVLLMHISNRFFDLGPIVGVMARDAGLAVLQRHDLDPDDMEVTGKFGSHWAVLARADADIGALRDVAGWESLAPGGMRAWTDDYSSVLPLLRTRSAATKP